MAEKVDQVAEAIYDSVPQWGSLWAKSPEFQEQCRVMARAAIAAMREPTLTMLYRGSECAEDLPFTQAEQVYSAMIDEALR